MNDSPSVRPWYTRIGPGLITACVVIGPGSILTSSTVGANNAYSMLWVVVVSVVFMLVYMTLGARLGTVADQSPGDIIRAKSGSALAWLTGFCVFFISAAFQSGNNMGVAAAFQAFFEEKWLVVVLVLVFNGVAISFLFLFENLYKAVEKLMMVFVGIMLVSFAINLVRLGPDLGQMAKGFVPAPATFDLALLGLVGTTFVITAAFYQIYLVRQKGWGPTELENGLVDARVGSVIMALITIMLMSTAAAGLYKGGEKVAFGSVVDVAKSLENTFGATAKVIFCLGLFCAAYSSFLVNSMIGGFIASDGLGLGSKPTDLWPRLLTALALLTGMGIALALLLFGVPLAPTIIAAQAVTVVGAPLVAGVLLWLTSRRDVMGDRVNGPITLALGGLGFVLLLGMAGYTAFVKIPAKIDDYRKSEVAPGPTPRQDSLDREARSR